MDLNNKVVLITGASSGIGYALVEQLTKLNCSFILFARRIELLEKLILDLKINSERVSAYKCDVSNLQEVKECTSSGLSKFGKIDIAILNAGISYRTSPTEFSPAKGREIMDVNFYGIVNCIEVMLPVFKKQERGIIAGVSSLAEGRGFPRSGFYSASKAAASILLESLRVELYKTGIKVITVKPGFVKTPMTDKNEFQMPFLLSPQKAADIIIKGIEKEKRIIQFPLPTVLSAKFIKIIPDSIFEWLAANHLTGFREIFLKSKK